MASTWARSASVAEQQERVGFALQVFPIETAADPVGRMLTSGRLAERLGFDAFFGDHPAWGPERWVHMATLAATTERIQLGTGVVCAQYRHPVMTARLAADLDNLSGGRLILGLGLRSIGHSLRALTTQSTSGPVLRRYGQQHVPTAKMGTARVSKAEHRPRVEAQGHIRTRDAADTGRPRTVDRRQRATGPHNAPEMSSSGLHAVAQPSPGSV